MNYGYTPHSFPFYVVCSHVTKLKSHKLGIFIGSAKAVDFF